MLISTCATPRYFLCATLLSIYVNINVNVDVLDMSTKISHNYYFIPQNQLKSRNFNLSLFK